ncbi:hypothetical protein [Actinoplanes sp. NPDC049265]|uniref:hypothetical protein n=1 Tax=Actinoplanes sp. NPDC049265 TaxID=3363902 RepID=UPI00371A4F53
MRDLDRFPVIDRTEHDERRPDFLSTSFDDPRLEALKISTNGTHGASLRVAWDLPSFFDLNHASYLRLSTVLPTLFPSVVAGEPTVFVISDSPRDVRASIVMPSLSGTVLRKLVSGRDGATDAALVTHLRRSRVALLHGKPSVLVNLAGLDQSHGGAGRIAPANIVCSGENLYPDDRARIEAWFGCPVLNAYVASETGMIGLECEQRAGLHVVTDHLTVEVAPDDEPPRATGTGQVLVTNALNWRHVFVRYRVGDRATVTSDRCDCGHEGQTVVALPGRERAAYRSGAGAVAADDIGTVIAAVEPPVRQYQVTQADDHRIAIRWVPEPGGAPELTAGALATALHRRFPAATFDLCPVGAAAINSPGGKLRRFL